MAGQVWRDNPVLKKELRSKSPLRAGRGDRGRITLLIIGLLIAVFYFFSVRTLFRPEVQSAAAELFATLRVGIEVSLLIFLTPAYAASSITQEREQQTWNALLLTRLTSFEIVFGKFAGALAPGLTLLILFAPLDIASAILGRISLRSFALSAALTIVLAVFCAALGLFFSWARRRTFQATAGAFGIIAFITVGVWILFGLSQVSGGNGTPSMEGFAPLWINPYFAMSAALRSDNGSPFVALFALIFYPVAAAALLWIVTARLRRGAKELEQ